MTKSVISGLILDFDGTLADSEPAYYQANRNAFRAFGHEIDEAEYYIHWSLHGEGAAGEIARYGLDIGDVCAVQTLSRKIYQEIVKKDGIRLLPFARELLERIPLIGCRTVIASNTSRDLIETILHDNGVNPIPVAIIGGDGIRPKPDPDIFIRAREHLALPASECLILEDTDKGVRAARASGIPFAVIHYRHYPDFHPPDAVAKFRDLLDFFSFITGHTG
ncbi:HAD family phosphatase [bacterium]|nr:HAD family phosphatase [candidate division CSSED10-310 bacterium]